MVSGLNWPMVVSILRNLISNDLCSRVEAPTLTQKHLIRYSPLETIRS